MKKPVEAHRGACLAARWSWDGAGIVTGGEDGAVKVSCDWSALVPVRDAALQPRLLLQPGVLRGLVTRQVSRGY